MEIINELMVKWEKVALQKKVIMIGFGVSIIFLLFFSQNKIEISGKIAGEKLTDNSGGTMIKNSGEGDVVLGDKIINEGDEKEIEEFKIKILNSSYSPLDKAVIYSNKECIESKKIYSKYDNLRKEYTFHIEIKRNRIQELSVKQKNYLCENFVIKQSNQTIKPIRLKINCNIEPKNNECLVQEEE